MRKQRFLYAPFFAIAALAIPLFVHAAALRMAPERASAMVGQPFRVDLVLDTQGDSANAIQATVVFPPAIFSLQSIEDGNSIVNFWVSPPAAVSPGTVLLAGIIPGGFSGSSGVIATLVLDPIAAGAGNVDVSTATVLRNDGQGSPIPTALMAQSVAVAPASSSTPAVLPSASLITPEPFVPAIASDTNIFGGGYFLAFSAIDTGTGIDHYEVLEVPTAPGVAPPSWQDAQSPYLLHDQGLSSNIYVRAVDHAGNFIVVELPAPHPQSGASPITIPGVNIGILVLALVVLFLLWIFVRRRRTSS